VRKRNKSRR